MSKRKRSRPIQTLQPVPVLRAPATWTPAPSAMALSIELAAWPGPFGDDSGGAISPVALAAAVARRAEAELDASCIPQLVTRDTMGDAIAFTDAGRVLGWRVAGAKLDRHTYPGRVAYSGLRPGAGLFQLIGHPLGVTYLLCGTGFGFSASAGRLAYSAVGTAGHRARVVASGGGAQYVADDCEGWDAVLAPGPLPGSGLHLARWRGSKVSWVAFRTPSGLWSGFCGYEGAVDRLFASAALHGAMPPTTFVEWLLESYALPAPAVGLALESGFTPERS